MNIREEAIGLDDIEKGPQPPLEYQHRSGDKATNTPKPTYHDVVRHQLRQGPWLESLCQFMDPTIRSFAINLGHRMNLFDIKVIHFQKAGQPDDPIKCTGLEGFKRAISGYEERIGTLIITKGISRAMIEALGPQFDIEPEFFATHLSGTELYRMGKVNPISMRAPPRAPYLLPEHLRKAPFYTIEYRRPYRIEGGSKQVFELRSTRTNTPRPIRIIHDELTPDHFAMERLSVYKKKGSNIGIILTDQLISDIPPSSYISSPVTMYDNDSRNPDADSLQHQVSSRRELISWIQHLTASEAQTVFDDREQLAMRPVLKMVERSGVMLLTYSRFIMNRVFSHQCSDIQFPDSIPFYLHISRSLQRHVSEQIRLLKSASCIGSLRCGNEIDEQLQDFDFLASNMEDVLKALKEDVRYLVGEASVREGRMVGWVSKFAALFLPISLLATILSISDSGYTRWVILGSLSVPFVLISIYFMFFWKPPNINGFHREP